MPLFYYVSDHEKDTMQKPLDAERLLRMLGASGKLAGFRQAAYMIERVRENPEYVQLITKRLYRETAQKFDTSSSCVERNLRTLIQTCWKYPDHSFLDLITGAPLMQVPTNTQFIDKSHKGCFGHYIRAVVLEQLVLQNLQRVIAYVQEDENEFARLVMRNQTAAQAAEQMQTRRLLEKNTRRMNELDTIIQRLYEDNIEGKVSDERFAKMTTNYEAEQHTLEQRVAELRASIATEKESALNADHFLALVRKYTEIPELTAEIIREFVERVYVYKAEKVDGKRVQRIKIIYNCIGEFALPDTATNEKTA